MTEQQLSEGWKMVKFGDIAKHISKRVEPSETELKVYVGLEHLDPDSLKIKRHGVPSDVAGQKLLVKKGQIIFGKRRAYQRKVAVADWDCICSAHAMVLEANSDNVIPEFLPFFMQSDVFMTRAIAISEGSLSPTIKWKVLENQTFTIPSLNEQKVLLDQLVHCDVSIERSVLVKDSLEQLKQALLVDFIAKNLTSNRWEEVALEVIADAIDPQPDHRTPKAVDGGVPYVGISDVINGSFDFSNSRKVSKLALKKQIDAFDIDDGAFIYGKIGTIGKPTKVTTDRTFALSANVILITSKNKLVNEYLFHLMQSVYIERQIKGLVNTTSQPALGIQKVRKLKIPFPVEDDSLLGKLHTSLMLIEEEAAQLNVRYQKNVQLKKTILNHLFSFCQR